MSTKSSTQAVLALFMDAQRLKRIFQCGHCQVRLHSDYIDAEYRLSSALREIPKHSADSWRLFAEQNVLVLIFTYCFEEG